jgi:DNA-3-methyladenine glycosylase II
MVEREGTAVATVLGIIPATVVRLIIRVVAVTFTRKIDFRASLAPLGRWGDDMIDRFDGHRLVRSLRVSADQPALPFAADVPRQPSDRLELDMNPVSEGATALVMATFVTQTDALRELRERDGAIALLAERYPGLVPVLIPDPFHALVRSISAQQINLAFAARIRQRLALAYGTRLEVGADFVYVLRSEALAAASVEDLRALQLTYAKARAVVATARAATAGELDRDDLERLDDEALIAHLTRLPGIGRWSAEWFLARTLGRPRVVAGDLGVRKAVGRLYDAGMPSETETRRLTEHWAGAATVAQALALHDLAVSAGSTRTVPAP